MQDFPKLDLHFIGAGSMLPPPLPPGGEQQRLAGIRILIARDNQRRTRLEMKSNGSQNLSLGLVPIEMMETPIRVAAS